MALNLERAISVSLPYSAKTKCTRKHAAAFSTEILIIILGLNAHLLYEMVNNISETYKEERYVTIDNSYSMFLRFIWSRIDLCVFSLISSSTIIVGNSLIIFKIKLSRRKAMSPYFTSAQSNFQRQNHLQSSMTLMLFTLDSIFLLTTLPVSIYSIGYKYWHSSGTQHKHARLTLWWALVNILMYTNNSINFLLYSLSGSKLRQEVRCILCP